MKTHKLIGMSALIALSLTGCAAGDGDNGGEGDQADTTLQVMMSPHSLTDVIESKLPEFEESTGIDVQITSQLSPS